MEWTSEDLEKAKQIIDYFKNHETLNVESPRIDTGRNQNKFEDTRGNFLAFRN